MTQETIDVLMKAAEGGVTIATGFLVKRVLGPMIGDRLAARREERKALHSQVAMIPRVLEAVQEVGDEVARVEGRSWSHCQLDLDRPIFEAEPSGAWQRVNRAMTIKTGFSSEQITGLGWLNLVDDADRSRVRNEWQAAVADGRECEIKCKVNTVYVAKLPMTIHALPIRRPCNDALIGFSGRLSFDDSSVEAV